MFSSCNRVKESKCVIPSFSQIDKLSPILLGTILKLFPIFFKQVCQTMQQLKYQPGHFDKMLISLHEYTGSKIVTLLPRLEMIQKHD